MPYRLTENIYAQDENGVLRLIERVPVNADAFRTAGWKLCGCLVSTGRRPP